MRTRTVALALLVGLVALPGAAATLNGTGGAAPLASNAIFNSLTGFTDKIQNNNVNYTITVTGTTNDGSGNDSITVYVYDDGTVKGQKTHQIPVGTTQTITDSIAWSGPIGTAAPGVGVYIYDTPGSSVLAYVDPFYLTGELPLTLSKSTVATASTGQDITYTITYGNTTANAMNNVVIHDTVPSGTTFVSATNGGTQSSGVVTWNIGTLAATTTGQTVQFTVHVTATSGQISNSTYSISATGQDAVQGAPAITVLGGAAPTPTATPIIVTSVPTLDARGLFALLALLAAAGIVLARSAR